MSGRVKPSDPVTAALYPQFRQIAMDTPLVDLARMFDRDHFAIVVTTQRCYAGAGLPATEKSVVAGVVSRCVFERDFVSTVCIAITLLRCAGSSPLLPVVTV